MEEKRNQNQKKDRKFTCKMGLFRKKCEYCKKKIEKGQEVFRDVKDPVFIGTREKAFCCSGHANSYMEEVKNAEECSSGCCG